MAPPERSAFRRRSCTEPARVPRSFAIMACNPWWPAYIEAPLGANSEIVIFWYIERLMQNFVGELLTQVRAWLQDKPFPCRLSFVACCLCGVPVRVIVACRSLPPYPVPARAELMHHNL